MNHALLAVGLGEEAGVEYAIVRNTWSELWGMNGYAKIKLSDADENGFCGMYQDIIAPVALNTTTL